jgi:hypothetical protein
MRHVASSFNSRPNSMLRLGHNRLLYCANPLHNVSTLPHELSQIFFCSFHHFLNVHVAASHELLCSRAHCRFRI